MGRKLGVCAPLGELDPHTTLSPGPRPTFLPSGILIHPALWPQYRPTWAENWGSALFYGEGDLVPISLNVAWAKAYLPTKWHLDPSRHLATTDTGRKLVGGAAGSPSNSVAPGPGPTCKPSFILIHPTLWPEYTNLSHRQTHRTDNGPTAYGEKTVAKNRH